jgi:hypothetical protein
LIAVGGRNIRTDHALKIPIDYILPTPLTRIHSGIRREPVQRKHGRIKAYILSTYDGHDMGLSSWGRIDFPSITYAGRVHKYKKKIEHYWNVVWGCLSPLKVCCGIVIKTRIMPHINMEVMKEVCLIYPVAPIVVLCTDA